MVDFVNKPSYSLDDLKIIVSILHSPGGCPWDREQTHESIRKNMLEEANEVVEAINEKNTDNLREELGDVLMQVLHHALISESNGNFNLDDIADTASKKLIRRHPHVFSNQVAADGTEAVARWENIKQIEKLAKEQGRRIDDMTPEEIESLSKQVKLGK
ncbi:MAG: MazG family protein [Oscillospiraceae bacterium]|jgi:tetrapyrrole methylase family protein/MazG family protein|nr:MazG family protein [Oscillospiraceae bacterium]